ncbi:MAG: chemotaxis protein CheA [Gemmatimonadaceae bacterium]|nr:chemotaxis protein CheA [Gemmatimonadaceae bacterium]
MDNAHYAELFVTESREHVSAINHSLLDLERGVGGDEPVGAIFRAVHTIKGMSATMGYTAVASLSHELETLLDRVRRGVRAVDEPLMELLFQSADVLESAIETAVRGASTVDVAPIVERLRAQGQEADGPSSRPRRGVTRTSAATAPGWTAPAPVGDGVLVRVRLAPETPLVGVRAFLVVQAAKALGTVSAISPSAEVMERGEMEHDFALRLVTERDDTAVDHALRAAGDVVDVVIGEATLDAGVERAASEPATFVEALATSTPADGTGVRQQRSVRIDLRRLDNLMNLIGELVITRGRLVQLSATIDDAALTETVTQASRLVADLQDEIMTSRMVPVWQVFDRFPRLVRDAAHSVHKEVDFVIEGKEVELDRSMLDEVGDPIVHLLRNAVDHGIEAPAVRASLGKPARGRLTLSALRDRSAVAIRVTDDGKGVDRERVLQRAHEQGLVEPSRTELSDEELFRIISRPGFSTADTVTDLSGRGVGIDAVYNRVRTLGGSVDMRSVPGQGTTVTMRLPLTLAIVRALLARIGNETYAVPMTHIRETVELLPSILRSVQGKEVMMLRDEVLPLMRMRELMRFDGERARGTEQVVVVELADRRAALVVDALIGQQEIVVKQFDGVRDGFSLFGGATILGDGAPALILDVSSLL